MSYKQTQRSNTKYTCITKITEHHQHIIKYKHYKYLYTKSFSWSGFDRPVCPLLAITLRLQNQIKQSKLYYSARKKLTDTDCWNYKSDLIQKINSWLHSNHIRIRPVKLFWLFTLLQCWRKVDRVLPVLGRGRHLEWYCQVCWGAQRCCSYTCSITWSPFRQGCWRASSSPFQSCL